MAMAMVMMMVEITCVAGGDVGIAILEARELWDCNPTRQVASFQSGIPSVFINVSSCLNIPNRDL
jgi:hypothetical protein